MRSGIARNACDAVLKWGLVGLIAFTPLAFGTVEAWSIAIMEWGIWTLVLVALLRASLREGGGGRGRVLTGLEAPILLFAAFCALQVVPIPVGWLETLSPGAARMYARTDVAAGSPIPVQDEVLRDDPIMTQGDAATRPVSVNPAETFDRLLLLVSFAAVFTLVAWWSTRPERALFVIAAVVVTGFVVSVFGIVQYLTWNGRIYWLRRVSAGSAFGPFVNHNHFAGYVGMIIPIAVCAAFFVMEGRRFTGGRDESATEMWGRAGLALYGAALLVAALFFSLSRGGILSTAVGGLLLFILLSRRIPSRLLTWSIAAGLGAVAVGFILWIGADVVSAQMTSYASLGREASFRSRAVVWKSMVEHAGPFLWTGSGLGTFEESFAPYTPRGSGRRWDRAHNDYLQLFWETGVPGALLLLGAAAVFIRRWWWRALRARAGPLSLFRVGLAVSILTIALHSVVDFNLQIGANGFLFAVLAGLLVGLGRAASAVARDGVTG